MENQKMCKIPFDIYKNSRWIVQGQKVIYIHILIMVKRVDSQITIQARFKDAT